ncbi:MAG TPA: EpsI family protein [Myxococcota bacterium]|nr:EpsI family protein [Myxococcota bacterium]
MTRLAVAIAFLALNFYIYHFMARQAVIPPRTTFASFPMEFGDWRCDQKQSLEPAVLENLGATDYLICDYQDPSHELVSLYVGYHATQIREEGGGSGENSIHPPAHCLPGSGWDIIDSRTVPLDLPGLPQPNAHVKRLVIARGKARQVVYYWYQTQGRVVSEDWKKILYVGYDRALHGRTDGALVRFTIPLEREDDEPRADRDFRDLALQVLPQLPPYIPN